MESHRNLQRALYFAYFYLKFRPRTRHEIINYLNKKSEKYHFSQEVIKQVIKELEELEYINDTKFIQLFVEKRTLHKQKSRFAITQELLKLGIDKDKLDEYFEENPVDETAQATEALRKKWLQYQSLDKRKRFEKAAAFLGRRGFSFDLIKKTIAEMEKKE